MTVLYLKLVTISLKLLVYIGLPILVDNLKWFETNSRKPNNFELPPVITIPEFKLLKNPLFFQFQ